ncbi:MAG: stage II sporulation protein M [Candidatus Diapherotrites archaeon]|uniref:Stage II sporulation protein M n=1 Tax=Candidatus Iainarchaeum sp. TaxID=3101447 RepID=A0A938YUM9_9ARCH|nr:stage II sporulation protein M [Candidatus Diapherotrites archaeon]
MVLESLFTSRDVLKHPLFMLFISIVVGSASLWIAYFTFPGSSSILAIAFVTTGLVPIMHAVFAREEEREAARPGFAASFLARHFKVIEVYAWFFVGLVLTYAFWYAAMPLDTRQVLFSEQEKTLASIGSLRENLSGNAVIPITACGREPWCWFNVIFLNNSSVLLASVLLSFVYGAGAVFLIGWNASVLGVLLGKDLIAFAGSGGILAGLGAAAKKSLGLLPHGIPEWLGYFVGAIAGGVISAAVSKRKWHRHEIRTISMDVSVMLFYAVALLFLGALIEAIVIAAAL